MARPGPNLPSISAVVLKYSDSASGATAINRLHVLSGGATALDVFNRFDTAMDGAILAQMPTTARLHTVDITRLDNNTATESFSTVGTKYQGVGTGQCLPQVCVLVSYSTGFRGLASHGRTYAPFVHEELAENGKLTTTGHSVLVTAWTTFVNALTSQTIPLQVVSYGTWTDDDVVIKPATNHTVTAVAVDLVLATQRNRQSRLRS